MHVNDPHNPSMIKKIKILILDVLFKLACSVNDVGNAALEID